MDTSDREPELGNGQISDAELDEVSGGSGGTGDITIAGASESPGLISGAHLIATLTNNGMTSNGGASSRTAGPGSVDSA